MSTFEPTSSHPETLSLVEEARPSWRRAMVLLLVLSACSWVLIASVVAIAL